MKATQQPQRFPISSTTATMLSDFFHRLRNLLIRAIVRALRLFSPSLNTFIHHIRASPGLPVSNPSKSYWLTPPCPIAKHGAGMDLRVPEYADVVIIGSGVTGTSVARMLLDWDRDHAHNTDSQNEKEDGASRNEPLQVVMLEARDACSGATGRNGGHITPLLYAEYTRLKEQYGVEAAKQIIRFRLAHLTEFLAVAAEEGLLEDSQCREVEAFDVFHDPKTFQTAKTKLAEYRADLPVESKDFRIYEGDDAIKELQLSKDTAGCLSTRAGAVHPYRLFTGILSRLLREYSSNFHLFTHTPCTAISSSAPAPNSAADASLLYSVITPKGVIHTPHVIHATNAWAAHLLPGMRGKIIPARGVMTAQRPQAGLGAPSTATDTWAGMRSFVFFPGDEAHIYDYLTQQRAAGEEEKEKADGTCGGYPPPEGEMMFGGGFARGNAFLTEFGNADDREWHKKTGAHLKGALGKYFDVVGEAEAEKGKEEAERVKAVWSGILGMSVDGKPWVGRIPDKISGRCAPRVGTEPESLTRGKMLSGPSERLAAPGEWMAAGYTGEGMVHAWMSGKALACMVLGLDEETAGEAVSASSVDLEKWFPRSYRINEERWEGAEIEDLFAAFLTS
ncbi:hypothetical protein D9615_006477 [Tricholomella constricta]|uniref:FAD dependent oxidoreductase domain-containing protein n=1 Tax=Tricholomella constricta TaxID=117010 RepID=A0A8H5H5S4_9AGAR|nr:hypothetical protein D9615_006477 [Tricholomella constricta]